jgi:polar amino acid transport system permease protein
MGELLPLLIQGAWVTLQVTLFGSILAIVAAILAALGRMSPWRALRWFSITYIEVFRGTSLLVQLFWLFFVLPLPPFNLELSPYSVAVVGLGLHIGAYGAEVMRGAISSVAKGQYERQPH